MSASERLTELEAGLTAPASHISPYAVIGGHGEWAELAIPYFALRNALPEIIAVVKGAENPNALRGDLDRALIALEAKLDDTDWSKEQVGQEGC